MSSEGDAVTVGVVVVEGAGLTVPPLLGANVVVGAGLAVFVCEGDTVAVGALVVVGELDFMAPLLEGAPVVVGD